MSSRRASSASRAEKFSARSSSRRDIVAGLLLTGAPRRGKTRAIILERSCEQSTFAIVLRGGRRPHKGEGVFQQRSKVMRFGSRVAEAAMIGVVRAVFALAR